MSSSGENLEKYRIPLHEILRATRNFSSETLIGDGGFGFVHIGQLSEEWNERTVAIKRLNRDGGQGNNEFGNELEMISSFHHPNIITFIGYCDEANEMIIVSEFAKNQSLDHHLQTPDKIRGLTWAQRLQICLGAAKGLKYLHSGLGEDKRVIHRDVKSANILLDDNLEAKICDFGLSKFGARNQEDTQIHTRVAGTRFYMDPGSPKSQTCTPLEWLYDDKPQYLIDVVRSVYDDEKKAAGPDKLIDPYIKDHADMNSFHTFNKIAHKCVNLKLEQRPTMERVIRMIEQALTIQLNHDESPTTRSLDNFLIPLEEINLATQNFNQETYIGDSGYGVVHRGQFYGRWQNRTMAITRSDPKNYKRSWGEEFKKELRMISILQDQNISRFIAYCDEDNDKIIVHEHAVNGTVADYLTDRRINIPTLTWEQRLKIILGTARGIQYLHLVLGEDNQATRGNINCKNILLDENMEAKISCFGLSRKAPYYHRPVRYMSDMYSFGVIMFEMLSGRRADELGRYVEPEDQFDLFQEYYRNNQLHIFLDDCIRDQIDSRCLNILIEVAYRCIKRCQQRQDMSNKGGRNRGRGPGAARGMELRKRYTMNDVVDRIEDAAEFEANET
ncbi:hypothetical protein Lser_V15G03092 [Lactuca serriola]